MERRAMYFSHERLKSRPKRPIAVAATKPAKASKFIKRQMAGRADQGLKRLPFGVGSKSIGQTGKNFRQRKRMAFQRGVKSPS